MIFKRQIYIKSLGYQEKKVKKKTGNKNFPFNLKLSLRLFAT